LSRNVNNRSSTIRKERCSVLSLEIGELCQACGERTLTSDQTTPFSRNAQHDLTSDDFSVVTASLPLAIMAVLENAYSLVHQDNAADLPSQQELKTQLEKGTDDTKVETMKRILTIMLNGDPMPNLLMHIIRFVMPSKSKPLKKLLYFYYEICPKLDANGKLKQEMILVWCVCRTASLQVENLTKV
jgi:hypothetical protein